MDKPLLHHAIAPLPTLKSFLQQYNLSIDSCPKLVTPTFRHEAADDQDVRSFEFRISSLAKSLPEGVLLT